MTLTTTREQRLRVLLDMDGLVGGEPYGVPAYALARMADCSTPDGPESPGAVWLENVADDALDAWEERGEDNDIDDAAHQTADDAVPIYTHQTWSVFVDLGAYNEDPTELGGDGADMTQTAKVCLYMIAERLTREMWELAEDQDDDR